MSQYHPKLSAVALCIGTLGAVTALPARGQQVAPPAGAASSASSMALENVTVTAQKRKEDPKKVPLSISVLSGDSIQEDHVTSLADLTRAVPNLSYSTQAGAGLGTLEMRGVSSQAGSATVSIYLDDISLTSRNLNTQGTAEPRFFDIDRVEVLRGPQGTLYGASSLGGTIKFISNQPDATAFSGSLNTELSTTAHGGTNYMGQAVLNVPLVANQTALRIGVQTGHDSGYIDQVSPTSLAVIDKGINSTQWNVLKLALKSEFAPGWSVTPSLFYQRFKSNDIDAAYQAVGSYQANADTPLARFQTSKVVREPGTDTLTIPSLTVNGDLGFADLTGVLSGYRRRFDRIQDGTFVNVPYVADQTIDPALKAVINGLTSAVNLANKTDQTSLELRLASKNFVAGGNPFTWVGGVYLAKTKTEVYDNEPIFGINQAFKNAGIDINDPAQLSDNFPGAGAFGADDSSYYSARHYTDKEYAVFGELTYNFDPGLRLTVGVRTARATQRFTREGAYFYTFDFPTTQAIDLESRPTTPRVALSWDASRETSFYANIAKGVRLGSAQRHVPSGGNATKDIVALGLPYAEFPDTYNSDSLWSYEAGMKSRWLENRLAVNVSIFHIDWKDIQQSVYLSNSGYTFELNAGRAKVDGIEIEGKLRAAAGLTLSAGASYTRAVFSADAPQLGTVGGDPTAALTVQKGDLVQGVPKYSAKLGAEYRFAPMKYGNTYVRANGQWTGSSRGDLNPLSPDYERPGYFTADASAGLGFDNWEFSVFAKNLTNTQTVLQQPSIQSVSQAYYLRPRTIGVTAAYNF